MVVPRPRPVDRPAQCARRPVSAAKTRDMFQTARSLASHAFNYSRCIEIIYSLLILPVFCFGHCGQYSHNPCKLSPSCHLINLTINAEALGHPKLYLNYFEFKEKLNTENSSPPKLRV